MPPLPSNRPGFFTRLLHAVKGLLILAVVLALGVFAFKQWALHQIDEKIRLKVQTDLQTHYQGLKVSVLSARRVEGKGIEIRGITIAGVGGRDAPILVYIAEVSAQCDTQFPDFISRTPVFRELEVRGLKLRAVRKENGTWNLADLLPLPRRDGPCPRATITEATIEIVDPQQVSDSNLTFRDIRLTVTPQALPSSATTSKAKPSASNATLLRIQGTLAGDHLELVEIDALLNPITGSWEMRGAVEGLEFNPRMRSALPRELGTLMQPLSSVRGRTHFGFHVTHGGGKTPAGALPRVLFTIDGQIAEGRIDDARLPDPMTDVEATIHCDNETVRIEDLSARCGQTIIENLNAEITGYLPNSPASIHLIARNVELDRVPVTSLPLAARDAWVKFSPRGHVDLEADLRFDGQQWQPNWTARCIDLSVLYDRFPFRIGDGKGSIVLKDGRLTADVRFLGGGQLVRCAADIQNPGSNYTGWIEVKSAGPLMLDERLISALDEKSQKVVRAFHPRGSVSFAGRIDRHPRDMREHRNLTLMLHNCTVQHDQFSYPIDKVSGILKYTDGDWLFSELSGRNDTASIVGSGQWLARAADGNQLALTFSATDVPLEDELRLALVPAVQRLWTNMRPRGTIDQMTVRMKYNPAKAHFGLEMDAHKAPPSQSGSISIEPAWFRYRMEDLTGDFYYRDGLVRLANIQAVHGKTRISTEGTCQARADGSSSVRLTRLTADNIQVDHELLHAVPAGLGESLRRLNLSGQINMSGNLGVAVPNHPDAPSALDWDLVFDVEDGGLEAGLPVEHIRGEVKFIGQSDGKNVLTRGELNIDSAIIRDIQFTQIQGPLWMNNERMLVGTWAERNIQGRAPRWVTATAFDGQVSLDGELLFGGEGQFQTHTTLENADLASIVAQLAPRQSGVTGKVFGVVNLAGTMEGVHTWRGDGQVRLKDAYLYELPAMVSTLRLLSIQRPERNAFTTSRMDFRIEGDDLEFTHLDLDGDVVSLKGKGRMNGQREVDLTFYTQLGRDELQLPIFRPLMGEVNRQFLLIEVNGPLESPQVVKTAFPRLNERLQQLFPELVVSEGTPQPTGPRIPTPREMMRRAGLLPKNK